MTTLTRQLTQLINDKPINAADLNVARFFLLDAAVNIIAGQNSVAGQKLLSWARCIAPDGKIDQLDAARKAFLLGALCHILEMDDLHRASVVHPGCVVAPVIFAMAGGQSGDNTLVAFLKGVEATTRVGMAVGPEHYHVWHNTATCGPFGSAIAGAYLLGLDENQSVHALGNAGTQSSGFWQFLDSGAETKHLHAGRGAEAGFVAAQLAAQGFTGAPDILEGSRGFFKGTCTNPPIENLLAAPDDPWQLHLTSIKPWSSCRHTHPSVEVALKLHDEIGGNVDDVQHIEIQTYQAALNLCDRPQPDNVYGAKFSLQHCVATALLTGKVNLAGFDEAARAKAATLADKITVNLANKYETAYPERWGSSVTLKLSGDRSLVQATTDPKGDPDTQLSDSELHAKAEYLLEFSGFDQPEKLIDQINQMGNGGSTPDLIGLLSPSRV